MQLQIRHVTEYGYDQPVDYALQQVRMRPSSNPLQEVADWSVTVEGGRVEDSYADHYGNNVDLVSADPGTRTMVLTSQGSATTTDKAGVFGLVYGSAPLWHFAQPTKVTAPGPAIRELAELTHGAGSDLDRMHNLSAAILEKVPYKVGVTGAETTAEEAIALGHGVCQDHTNIMIAAARCAGIPARYVSGYLFMPDRVDQDASHAWAELHLDGLGWVGFDVSNGIAPDEKYLRIAIGRDAQDAAPVRGLRLGAASESLVVSVQVQQ